MTRWARSGNTQKHKKMPGDATPWKEFSKPPQTKEKFSKKSLKKGKETMKNSIPGEIDNYHDYKFANTSSFIENPKNYSFSESSKISNKNGNVSQNQEENTEGLRKLPSLNKNSVECLKRKKRNQSKKNPKKTNIQLNERPCDSLINVNLSLINIINNNSKNDPHKIKIEVNKRPCDSNINIQEDYKMYTSSGSSKDSFLQNAQCESNSGKVQEDIKKGVTNDGKKLSKNQLKKINKFKAKKLKHNPISSLGNSQSRKNINEPDVKTLDNQEDSKIYSSSASSKDSFLQNAQCESNSGKVQDDIKKGVTNDGEKLSKRQLKKINKIKANKLFHNHMKESLLANKLKHNPISSLDNSHSKNINEPDVKTLDNQEDFKMYSNSGSSEDKVQDDSKKGVTNDGKKLSKNQLKKMKKIKAKKLFHNHMKESLLANKLKHNPISSLDNSHSSKNINEPDVRALDNQKNVDCNVPSVKNATSDTDKKKKRKLMYMERLKERRAEKGIILLPAKVERKLYNIRKKLKEKGISVAILKEIIRKERRKEELKFRKTFSSKICFNCRQTGHLLAECPNTIGTSGKKIGSCFKCGSEEHTSVKCPNDISGFPHAMCFICKQQGHISRECPRNSRGVYPKGGKCKICGNVNHLQKDCPSLKKKKEETTMTVHTITEGRSIDDEIENTNNTSKNNKKFQKPKVVKF